MGIVQLDTQSSQVNWLKGGSAHTIDHLERAHNTLQRVQRKHMQANGDSLYFLLRVVVRQTTKILHSSCLACVYYIAVYSSD